MSESSCFHVRAPKVIFEHFDDEVVAVNLDTGSYYSLREVAADVWTLLAQGCSAAGAAHALSQRHPADAAAIEKDIPAFLEELAREGLITPGASLAQHEAEPCAAGAPERRYAERYSEPLLARYSDMQELLLLDPIHDVDETGWPTKAS
jgi:hypothetical protein